MFVPQTAGWTATSNVKSWLCLNVKIGQNAPAGTVVCHRTPDRPMFHWLVARAWQMVSTCLIEITNGFQSPLWPPKQLPASLLHILFNIFADEDSFPYTNGEGNTHTEISKDRTIMLMGSSAQKISVRLQPTIRHRATQTDDCPPSPSLLVPPVHRSRTPDPSLNRSPSPCPSPMLIRKRAYAKWENKDSVRKAREERRGIKPTTQELEKVS